MATISYAAPKTRTPPAQPTPPSDTTEAETALTIHGNQEQPTVLYIVPWQDASDHQPLLAPNKPLLKHVFQHIERGEHERQLQLNTPANPPTPPAP